MSVAHVVDVAQKLEFVVHSRDDGVDTVSGEGDLFVEFGIAFQGSETDFSELGEVFLDAGSLLEESLNKDKKIIKMNCTAGELIPRISLDEDGRDDGVAVASQVLPAPLDVADLVGRQFGLGISQIFGVPIEF